MNWINTTERYGWLSIAMHWLVLALLIGVYACIESQGLAPRGSALRADLKTWHFMLGLTVFGLVAVRLTVRLFTPTPRMSADVPAWQGHLAKLMHGALYAFLIVMPVLGWLTLSAGGKTIPWFGLELPALIGADRDFSRAVKEVHETLGNIGYYLVGLHAAAALYHHYFVRDDTLLRMLPRRGQ
ncbi:MAG: cytochrome b [Rhodanobacter sp.]